MTVSISNEYLWWDNVETVFATYSIDGNPQPRKQLDYALRVNPTDNRSNYQGMRTSSREVTWWLPVAEFGTEEPDGNMKIEDADHEIYLVNETSLVRLGSSKSHWNVKTTRGQKEQ